MIINNIEKIRKLLEFDTADKKDTFYFVQIMQRKKDNILIAKERNNNARTIKLYYIDNIEYFDIKTPEIIALSELFNARAYISLSKKSYEQIAFESLKSISDNMFHKNYKQISHSYSSCCGRFSKEKTWLIDFDSKNLNVLESIKLQVNNCNSGFEKNIIEVLETINGFHIITHPFDIRGIKELIQNKVVDLHKDNPTLLYFNKKGE